MTSLSKASTTMLDVDCYHDYIMTTYWKNQIQWTHRFHIWMRYFGGCCKFKLTSCYEITSAVPLTDNDNPTVVVHIDSTKRERESYRWYLIVTILQTARTVTKIVEICFPLQFWLRFVNFSWFVNFSFFKSCYYVKLRQYLVLKGIYIKLVGLTRCVMC